MYDTVRAALEQLENARVFERVACRVLEVRFPGLRPTTAGGDLGRDGYVRAPFGTDEGVVLLVSLQDAWTSKLASELRKNREHDRHAKAVFVTTRTTNEAAKEKWRDSARDDFGVDLEIVDLDELVYELERDELRWVGEVELGVRPRAPRALAPATSYLEHLGARVPGMTAPLVSADTFSAQLRTALAGRERIVTVEGHGGVGKTRLVLGTAIESAATLVLATAAPLQEGSFTEIPLGSPSVLVVDNAHRRTDLGSLALLLDDPRFDRVLVILVVRPGHRHRVLYEAGVESYPAVHLTLEALSHADVDRIACDHGVSRPEIRRHVVRLADGNPSLAHRACEAALSSGVLRWADSSQIMASLVTDRLDGDRETTRELRATAVALALTGTAGDERGMGAGQDLAPLFGTITGLPPDPHRLDHLLARLEDAGLATGRPYALRPRLLGPVVLAQALRGDTAVHLDLAAALPRAGRAQRSRTGGRCDGLFWVIGLIPVLQDLAAAVLEIADRSAADHLARFVRSLVVPAARLDDWWIVAFLAHSIAPAAPTILADLHRWLVAAWPVETGPGPADLDAEDRRQQAVSDLARQYADLARRTDEAGRSGAVAAVLDLAYLCDPDHPDAVPVREIAQWRLDDALLSPGRWGDLMALRQERLETIAQWSRDLAAEPPSGLSPAETRRRGPATLARVVLAAVEPLLTGFAEITTGTPLDPNTYRTRRVPLPDHPDLARQLREAAELPLAYLEKAGLRRPENRETLLALVRIPTDLRRGATSPLPGTTRALPAYTQRALEDAAAAVSARIAEQWHTLPLEARRLAADGAARPGPPPPGRSSAADPVAVAAAGDPMLQHHFILHPPRSARARPCDDSRARSRRALRLASQVSTDDALILLEAVGPHAPASATLDMFARAVGAAAPDPDAVLARLRRRHSFAGNGSLLAGIADTDPGRVWAWIESRLDSPRVAGIALTIVDEHPDQERRLLSALALAVRRDPTGAARTGLARDLVSHLLSCLRPVGERLALLADVGRDGPADVLPHTLRVIGLLLADPVLDSRLVGRCVAVARRALHEAVSSHRFRREETAAEGARLIAAHCPAPFAALVTDHLAAGRHLPGEWAQALCELDPAAREHLAHALLGRWPRPGTGTPPALSGIATLGGITAGTHAWDTAVRTWATGTPGERALATAAVSHQWESPTWQAVVPALLTSGLDQDATGQLVDGITTVLGFGLTGTFDSALKARHAALDALRAHPRHAVRAFARDVDAVLDGLRTRVRSPSPVTASQDEW
ncbi:restriction endonuclease [Kitasatospora sp. NPDC058046]|uniref:restriction endonuclease n=1 Tax=Kitasatospora sp. NPDC058046 TaxID=3346312 RepID=UPI0036D978A5